MRVMNGCTLQLLVVASLALSRSVFAAEPVAHFDNVGYSMCFVDAESAVKAARLAGQTDEGVEQLMRMQYIGKASPEQIRLALLAKSSLDVITERKATVARRDDLQQTMAQMHPAEGEIHHLPDGNAELVGFLAGVCYQSGIHGR
ncbi:hypothetical protein [Burkholderia gladioli]|uniref:hypothetical protein n=1 Tax=Burkholderia gladioli TaxID=28095 RepID=UPI001641B142|nr:hypothetical protein [Burkholderia gladioli]